MATRAAMFPMFLCGLRIPATDVQLNAGVVYFYEVGSTTEKTVWQDQGKTSAYTQPVSLDAYGQKEIYGEGSYKIVVKTAVGGTTLYTWDQYNIKHQPTVVEVQASTDVNYTMTDTIDYLFVAATGKTITLPDAATATTAKTIKNIISATTSIVPAGSDAINGDTAPVTMTGLYATQTFVPLGTVWYGLNSVADAQTLNGYSDAATPGITKIVRSEGDGKINDGWIDKTDFVASTSATGFVELATDAEAIALTDTARALTASNMAALMNVTAGGPPIYSCRAWVCFDGTVAAASMIKADGNVTSITDNGTGDATINFTTNMPDAYYVAAGVCQHPSSTGAPTPSIKYDTPPTTAAYRAHTVNATTAIDCPFVHIAFFR